MGTNKTDIKTFNLQRLLEIIVAFVLAMIFIAWYFAEKKDFANLALGEGTVPYFATDGTYPIHLDEINKISFDSLMLGWEERGKKDVIFCLGNSQTHSLNQLQKGQVNYTHLLFNEYQSRGYDVITHSIPNCNLQEFYLFIQFWKEHLPIKMVLIPTFMDDTRENDIHNMYIPYLVESKFTVDANNPIALKINAALDVGTEDGDENLAALRQTTQEKSETFLNAWLDEHFAPWEKRPNVRGAFFNWLYNLRNTIFGISAQTKRKVIKNAYDDNLTALEEIYSLLQKDNIDVIGYIPPIRNDKEVPYVLSEYEQFKKDVETVSNKFNNVQFLNLEGIIPAQYWGTKGSTNLSGEQELDFMHFQYPGHVNLYDALNEQIKTLQANDI